MIDLLPHNEEAYKKVKEVFADSNKTCIVQPTGSGKSYLILKLIEDYAEMNRDVIVIEPQKLIFDQLKDKMVKYGLSCNNVKFITYSALSRLTDEKIQKFDSPCLVVVDEMHRAGAVTWIKGLQTLFEKFPDDCKYVGLSATPIRYLDGKRNMCEELFNGSIASELSLPDAIINRVLPLPRYIAGLYTYENEVNAITKKIQQSSNNEEEKKALLEEVKIMKRNLDRSKGISEIFRKYMVGDSGKYVAFCRNINHLSEMRTCLENWFTDAGINANMYEVHCKNPEKNEQFQAFKSDDGLAVCLSINMLSEGLHGIDGVILLRDTVSPNLYYQQIGRAFAVGMKSVPIIFDLVANCDSVMECGLKADLLAAMSERDAKKGEQSGTGGNDGDGDDGGNEITRADIENFFVFDQVIDAINAFNSIEGRLQDSWDLYIGALKQYKERTGNCLVPSKHVEALEDGTRLNLGNWVMRMRGAKMGIGLSLLTPERIAQLDNMGFVWDAVEYNFEVNVVHISEFIRDNGRYPRIKSKEEYESKLAIFRRSERGAKRRADKEAKSYPKWKSEIIERIGLKDFFEEKESSVERFCRMVLKYRKMYGHINIKQNDIIGDYKIGYICNNLFCAYKNNKLTKAEIIKLESLGINITKGRFEQRHEKNMALAKQALSDGVFISNRNQSYKGVNLYMWYFNHKDKFTENEMVIMNKLIVDESRTSVKIFDLEKQEIKIFPSNAEASRALCNDYQIVDSEHTGWSAIHNHLTGKTKNPIYKGRFRFEYADKKDIPPNLT